LSVTIKTFVFNDIDFVFKVEEIVFDVTEL